MGINELLRDKGLKVTPQRKAILEVLGREKKALDANQIFSQVLDLVPQTNFSTVYRNLDTLLDKDLVCQISRGSSADLYKLRREEDHHHHLICEACGGVVPLDFCPMEGLDDQLEALGFKARNHNFEIYGLCKDCR